jgi:hypothetical protein
MPVEYLRVPYFSLATYYAGLCAQRSEVRDYETYQLHREVIGELSADALQQYFAEVSLEFPSFNELSVARVLREPDDLEGPDTFEINIPLEGRDLQEYIPEEDLMNPRLNMVKWVHRRVSQAVRTENTPVLGGRIHAPKIISGPFSTSKSPRNRVVTPYSVVVPRFHPIP